MPQNDITDPPITLLALTIFSCFLNLRINSLVYITFKFKRCFDFSKFCRSSGLPWFLFSSRQSFWKGHCLGKTKLRKALWWARHDIVFFLSFFRFLIGDTVLLEFYLNLKNKIKKSATASPGVLATHLGYGGSGCGRNLFSIGPRLNLTAEIVRLNMQGLFPFLNEQNRTAK